MTRAEAIRLLSGLMFKGKLKEALDMAIASLKTDEAYQLEYERTTKNDLGVDCISRDEVCRYVAEFVNHEFSTREEEELIDNIITGIEHLPSVTPQEPKAGHWIDCDNSEDYSADGYDCSVCGVNAEYATSYCPNCGARMVEPQESEG